MGICVKCGQPAVGKCEVASPQRITFNAEMRELYRLSHTVEDDNADVLARGLRVERDWKAEALAKRYA
jgi:hypothetical protein